jgi:hypothetical protein
MSDAFNKLSPDKLNAAVADLLGPRIGSILSERGPGHCMRVTDLDHEVMESICTELRKKHPAANIFILGTLDQEEKPYRITSTKLVELRNPDENGELRQPLLVFIPISLRTSAEDSFGVATFEELTFPSIYEELIASLMSRLPATLIESVRDLFSILSTERRPFGNDIARVRYLLTALENGIDGETLGASLYELMLIPDFKLFADPGMLSVKIRRNVHSVRNLLTSHKSIHGRIAQLRLSDKDFEARLNTFFENTMSRNRKAGRPPLRPIKAIGTSLSTSGAFWKNCRWIRFS